MTPAEIAARVAEGLPGEEVRCGPEPGGVTVTVPPQAWPRALQFARDVLECDFFDWLTAVDEQGRGIAVVVHLYSLAGRHHLLLRTMLDPAVASLASATGVYRGAAWHERETHEMFGVEFDGHPGLAPLLLPDGFEGHPLRKDFMLAARGAREWPGLTEPGTPQSAGRTRRLLPPGVPEGWAAAR